MPEKANFLFSKFISKEPFKV